MLELLPFVIFVILPAGVLATLWFCLLGPQRLISSVSTTAFVNIYFGFFLIPAFAVPAPGFHPEMFVVSCVPVAWALVLLLVRRSPDEGLSGWLGIASIAWPLMTIDYFY